MEIFSRPMSFKQYVKYLMPSLITMVFLSFYITIDGFFVSKYAGSNALAGINIVIPITSITFGVSIMLATGAGAIIGEYSGKEMYDEADNIFSMASMFLLIFSLILTVTGVIFLKPIAVFLGAGETLMPYVLPYELIIFIGAVPMVFKLFFEYLVRTDGNPKIGLYMSFIGIILNVVFDFIFVAIFKLGTLGAGLGTTISITTSATIGFIYFKDYSNLRFISPKWNFKILLKACTNGCSEMLTEFSTGITTLLFNLIIMSTYGEDGVAAVSILMYIYYFFISFYRGIAAATAPIISYNLGAHNKTKIKESMRYAFITIGITMVSICLIMLFGSDLIISIFVGQGSVFELTQYALKLFSPVFIFMGINVFLSSYFTALGDGLSSAIISSLRSLIFVVIFIITLPKIIGFDGIWLTMPVAEICTIVVSLILYKKKRLRFDK